MGRPCQRQLSQSYAHRMLAHKTVGRTLKINRQAWTDDWKAITKQTQWVTRATSKAGTLSVATITKLSWRENYLFFGGKEQAMPFQMILCTQG